MARKELCAESFPEISNESPFIKFYQERILLLLKRRGVISETQYTAGLRRMSEKDT